MNDGTIRPSIAICLPEISIGIDSSLLRPCPYALLGKSRKLLLDIKKNNHISKAEINII
jgi:hypothetical protein